MKNLSIMRLTRAVVATGIVMTARVALAAPQQSTPATPDAAEQRKFLQASRNEHDFPHEWKPVVAHNFEDAKALESLRVINGEWRVEGGELKAVGGPPDANRTVLITPVLEGAQRIEFDVTLLPRPDGRVGDVCVRLNADPQTGSFARGYALITAQYFNQSTVCYRLNIPIARTEGAGITPGKRHRVVVLWKPDNGHLRFFVDDKIILDTWDRTAPLKPDPTKWIGLSTYGTQMIVDNLIISSGTKVQRARPAKTAAPH